ncbi:MAG: large subunit ribosomal protein L15 [Comamonadaceae bacterium]|nr:MAG: large subunit ribosomal protein L15 [Comamonadaceae bacterium]
MPMQRRLPKRGFKSALLKFNAEITLGALDLLETTDINIVVLKQAGLVGEMAKVVKVIKTGNVTKAYKLSGVGATEAAKAAILAAGGSLD